MLKKAMLALGIAGVLIVPAGAAVAATDAPVEQADRNRVTTLTRDQTRDQTQDQTRDQARDRTRDQTRDRTMTRDRLRIQDPATCGGTGPKGSSQPGIGFRYGAGGR